MKPIATAANLLLCLCLLIACPATTAHAVEGGDVLAGEAGVARSARAAGKAGAEAEQWETERTALMDEARQLLFDIESTRFAADRQEAYIATEQKTLRDLTERLDAARETRQGLEPLMEGVYDALIRATDADLPFAGDERQTRLALLRKTLDDPDAATGDKLGRLLEALRMEAAYGQDVEAEDAVETVDGAPMALTVLRVGRLALVRMPASGDWVERYDRKAAKWARLGDESAREVTKAIQIARKRRTAELVTLPVGTIGELMPETTEAQ
ncbi:DUF3450 domain-containing protein [Pseudodesulfovibrio cashew]|uniref:DUF3450 domain-containing protein n=1 Tax=Pseudodesulfovibrio cashew TaxID=2678688 RepID=UPI00131C7710|nr:DUF3450 domain-containing protein [Pseudodesulfovibrio cashew]